MLGDHRLVSIPHQEGQELDFSMPNRTRNHLPRPESNERRIGSQGVINSRSNTTLLTTLTPFLRHSDNLLYGLAIFWNPHAVERAVNEDQGSDKEEAADHVFGGLVFHGHGDFHGEQAKERGELDYRIHCHR